MNQREGAGNIFINLSGSVYLKCPACGECAEHKLRGDLRAGKESHKIYLSMYEPKEQQQTTSDNRATAPVHTDAPPPPDESNAPPEQEDLPF